MVLLHRLDGTAFYLNAELVETVESTPDTVIVLNNGHRYIVREQAEEVIARILSYRRLVSSPFFDAPQEPSTPPSLERLSVTTSSTPLLTSEERGGR